MPRTIDVPSIWPRWSSPAPAPSLYDAPGLAPGPRFSCWFGHSYVLTRQPDGWGADRFAYEALGLTEYSPIGPSTHNRMQLTPFPYHSTVFAGQGLTAAGLGGLVRGQFVQQPLLVPSELQTGSFDPADPMFSYGNP